MSIEKLISPFIESQFPQFYQEEGPQFIEFVKAYYSWLESQGEILHEARSLLEYRDIDTTLQNFMVYFKNKYINSIPENILADKSLLIKYILDLYRSKGSDRSYALLFKILFNEDIEIYTPGKDVFKLSDGDWVVPKYIELTDCPYFVNMIGHKIYSSSNFASAVVDNYFVKFVNNKYINVLILNDIKGNFTYGEKILCEAVPEITIDNGPIIIGSLSSIGVTDGGLNYNVGDLVNVNNSGVGGVARVVSTTDRNGQVQFTLLDGGSGFSLDAIVNVVGETREIDSITLDSFVHVDVAKTEGIFGLYENIYFSNNLIANNKISGAVLSTTSNVVTGNSTFSIPVMAGDLVYFESNNQVSTPSTTKVNTTTNKINITNHGYSTGDKIYYLSLGSPAIQYLADTGTVDLIDDEPYYVIKFDNNYIYLALTKDDAIIGATETPIGLTKALNLTGAGNPYQIFKNTVLNANVIVGTVYDKENDHSFILTEKPSWSSANATSGIVTGSGVIRNFDYVTGNVVISNSSVSKVITDIGPPEVSILPIDYLTSDHKIIASTSQASTVISTSDDVRYVITVKPQAVKNSANKIVSYKGHMLENRDTVRLDYIQGVENLNIQDYSYYVKVVNTYAFELFTDRDLDANTSTNYYTDELKKANYQVPVIDNPYLYYIPNSGYTYQNPGGVGATFKIGSLVNKEIYRLNTDHIEDYVNERMESDARVGGGWDIHLSDVVGTFSSGDILVIDEVPVKRFDAGITTTETLMANGEFMFGTGIGDQSHPELTVVNTDESYIETISKNPSLVDTGVNNPSISGPRPKIALTDLIVDDVIYILNHSYVTGDPTYYRSNGGDPIRISEVGYNTDEDGYLLDNQVYYVNVIDVNHFKLALNKDNAIWGITYNITETGNDAQTFRRENLTRCDIAVAPGGFVGNSLTSLGNEFSAGSSYHVDAIMDDEVISLSGGECTSVIANIVQLQQIEVSPPVVGYPIFGGDLKSIGHRFVQYNPMATGHTSTFWGGESNGNESGVNLALGNPCLLYLPAFSIPPINTPISFQVYNNEEYPQPTLPYGMTAGQTYYSKFVDDEDEIYFENKIHFAPTPFIPVDPADVNLIDNKIYVENHGFVTGDSLYYVSKSEADQVVTSKITYNDGTEHELEDEKGSQLSPLVDPPYGIIRLNDNEFQIALTPALALAETPLILSGAGNIHQSIRKSHLIGCGVEFAPEGTTGAYEYPPYDGADPNHPVGTKYEIYFDKAQGTVIKTDRLTHYDFPKITVAPYDDRENLDTYISDALTYVDKEVGDIARLSNINSGEGYANDPKVVVIEPLIYELREVGKNGGYKGFNANVVAKAGYAGGIATAIEIVDSGYGYERDQQVALTNENNPYGIIGTTVIDLAGKSKGYWKSNQGFLSDQIYLQDSYFYQKFSYEIIASRMLNTYETYVKDLVHPSGMKLFGRFINKNELEQENAEVVYITLNKNVITDEAPPVVKYGILTDDNTKENVDETTFTSDQKLKPYPPSSLNDNGGGSEA
jgi:hypothetical protein